MKRFLAVLLVIVLIGGNLSTAALADDWDWSYEGFSEDDWYDDGWSESYDYYTSSAQDQANTTYDYPEYSYETAPETSFDWDGFDKDEFDWSKIFLGEDGYWYTEAGEKLFSDDELNDWLDGMEPSEDTGLKDADDIRAILEAEHEAEDEIATANLENPVSVQVTVDIVGDELRTVAGDAKQVEANVPISVADLLPAYQNAGFRYEFIGYTLMAGNGEFTNHSASHNAENAMFIPQADSTVEITAQYKATKADANVFRIIYHYDPNASGRPDDFETEVYTDSCAAFIKIPENPLLVDFTFTVGDTTQNYYKTFLGWATDESRTTIAYKENADITLRVKELNLYDVWQDYPERPYYLEMNVEGQQTVREGIVAAPGGHNFSLSEYQPTKDGYVFEGWYQNGVKVESAYATEGETGKAVVTARFRELGVTGVSITRDMTVGDTSEAPVFGVGNSVTLGYNITVTGDANSSFTVTLMDGSVYSGSIPADGSAVVIPATYTFGPGTELVNGCLQYSVQVTSGVNKTPFEGFDPCNTPVTQPPAAPGNISSFVPVTVRCTNAENEHDNDSVTYNDYSDEFYTVSSVGYDGSFFVNVTFNAQRFVNRYIESVGGKNHILSAGSGDVTVKLINNGDWQAVSGIEFNTFCVNAPVVHYKETLDGYDKASDVIGEDTVARSAEAAGVELHEFWNFLGWDSNADDVADVRPGDRIYSETDDVFLTPVWSIYAVSDYIYSVNMDDWRYDDTASDPEPSFEGPHADAYGEPQIQYYDEDDNVLPGRPVNAGSYRVNATWTTSVGDLPSSFTAADEFTISPRSVIFVSRYVTKIWDDKPLNNAYQDQFDRTYSMDGTSEETGVEIRGDGMAAGDTVTFSFPETSARTTPGGTGRNENKFTYIFGTGVLSSNYSVTTVFGDLVVTRDIPTTGPENPGGAEPDVTPEPVVTPRPVVSPNPGTENTPEPGTENTPNPGTENTPNPGTENSPEPSTEPDEPDEPEVPVEPTIRPVVPTPPQNGGDTALPSDSDFGDYDPNSPELDEPAAPAEPVTPAEPETPAAPETPVVPVAPETPDDTTPAAPEGPTEIAPDDTPLDDVPQIPGAEDNAPSATPRPEATPAPTASPAPAAPVDDESGDNGDGAEPDGDVTIDEDDTPLADLPEVDDEVAEPELTIDEEVIIDEDDTPLANFTDCCALHFVLMLLALGVAVYYTYDRKKRQAREFEVRSEL